MSTENYYEVLGVAEDGTTEEIKRVYKQLARLYHPDSGGGKAGEEKFKRINEAYAVLKNPVKRREYDVSLMTFRSRTKTSSNQSEVSTSNTRQRYNPSGSSDSSSSNSTATPPKSGSSQSGVGSTSSTKPGPSQARSTNSTQSTGNTRSTPTSNSPITPTSGSRVVSGISRGVKNIFNCSILELGAILILNFIIAAIPPSSIVVNIFGDKSGPVLLIIVVFLPISVVFVGGFKKGFYE